MVAGSVCSPCQARECVAGETSCVVAQRSEAALLSRGEILREIDDPATGDRWLLVRDAAHPAAPARLVLAARQSGQDLFPEERKANRPAPSTVAEQPVIRAGDLLTVEEHTAVVDTRLEAVALGPAPKGAILRARLKIGGRIVRVEAVSRGHALFCSASEVAR